MTTFSKTSHKVLFSGGGTGGHIFPAIAIAEEWKRKFPNSEILFVGANGKMEMELVPKYGFKIVGLPIRGLLGKAWFSKLLIPFRFVLSVCKAFITIKKFKPTVAIGTGGYASGVSLWVASKLNIPVYIQEQNAVAGLTNRWLSSFAKAAFVAYPDMDQQLKCKTYITGNPIRFSIQNQQNNQDAGFTILSIGGSLGAKSLNEFWIQHLTELEKEGIYLIWQCGRGHKEHIKRNVHLSKQVELVDFILDIQQAYQRANLIISRAGALAISELALVGKPIILIPFPYAVADHQTQNAQRLVQENAALMVKDSEVHSKLWKEILRLKNDLDLQKKLSKQLKQFAQPNAAEFIVNIITKDLYGA